MNVLPKIARETRRSAALRLPFATAALVAATMLVMPGSTANAAVLTLNDHVQICHQNFGKAGFNSCLLYTSPSPRDS